VADTLPKPAGQLGEQVRTPPAPATGELLAIAPLSHLPAT
jgi:hypothetical protein